MAPRRGPAMVDTATSLNYARVSPCTGRRQPRYSPSVHFKCGVVIQQHLQRGVSRVDESHREVGA